MDESQVKHLKKLREMHRKRLQILEVQSANFGALAPPHILMEIEDIQSKIETIDNQFSDDGNSASVIDTSNQKKTILFVWGLMHVMYFVPIIYITLYN